MAETRNIHRLINLHTSGTNKPAGLLELGEIAVQHSPAEGTQRLIITTIEKGGTDSLVEFAPTTWVESRLSSIKGEAVAAVVGNATTDYDTLGKVETKIKAVQDIADAAQTADEVSTAITNAINDLDTSASSDNDFFKLTVDEEDGKVTSVSFENKDIASAATLKTHTDNTDIHVTADDKAKWDAAESNAKEYTDDNFVKLAGYVAYTTDEKTKLAGIAEGAQVNVIESVKVNGTPLTVTEKSVNVEIPAATVTGVKSGDKILALNGTELYTTLTFTKEKIEDAEYLVIKGKDGVEIGKVATAEFTADSFLNDVTLDESDNLKFTWLMADGSEKTDTVNISKYIDTYTAGNGLKLESKEFSVKLAEGSEGFLTVDSNGVKLSGIQNAINTAVANKNVTAEGDSYVTASAEGNKVTVAASESTKKSLGLADSALQKADIETGTENGTIKVDDVNVPVYGLDSAAYTKSTDYATAAQGTKADSAVQKVTVLGEELTNGSELTVEEAKTALGLKSAAYTEASAYATAAQGTKADSAIQSVVIAEGKASGVAVATNENKVATFDFSALVIDCGTY